MPYHIGYLTQPAGSVLPPHGPYYIYETDKNGVELPHYLHSDGKWRLITYSGDRPTGYYNTREEAQATIDKYLTPPPQERWVLVKSLCYADHRDTYYFVGEDEGWSVMPTVAYIFQTPSDITRILKIITTFYDNIEIELLKAPSAVRSIRVYPQSISQDWNQE